MIHQPLGGAQGQAADIEIQANEIMVRTRSKLRFPSNKLTPTTIFSAPQVNSERLSRGIHWQASGHCRFITYHNYWLRDSLYESHRSLQVMQDTDRDFFMSAFEAKEYGLIDSVIEHPTDVAVRSSGIPMYAGELW